ncbi:O-antigen ligase family protein [Aureibaculum sp. 2210JD6-5]|uniref:O-antigen ligase family protein n=1 Tax=Aureibaculum sp. 2210JD6-5 TaxID=3103957 RepID=UPI002AAC8BB7|nr:O-antigen ligase family protein [Aureibaculum sp. 2210JD6-5]MDY7396735.1 O-antigen ligase family protein [Aureibaculum sp. 2210JD6-5]
MERTKAPLIFLSLLLVVLPQINLIGYVQPTITSKFIVFAYSCLVLVGGFIIMFSVSGLKAIQITKLDIFLFLLLGYITINRYFIQPNFGFSIRYMELLALGILYVVLRTFPIKSYIWLLLAIVISGIIQAIYGNLQLLGYYPSNHSGFKMTGSFFNPGPYAGFLAAVWPITLGMYLFKENIIAYIQPSIRSTSRISRKIIQYIFEYTPLLGLISIILVIPATRSRGAWLAVLVSSFILLEFKYHFIQGMFKKTYGVKRITLLLVTFIIFCSGLCGIYQFKKGSSDGRLFIWKVTAGIIKDFPVTGVGFDRFKAHYMDYQANYFKEHGETREALVADNTYYAFNEWLQFVSENGLVGAVLMVIVLFTLFKIQVVDKNKYIFLIAKATFLAIGAFAFVSYPMQILPIKVVLATLLALLGCLNMQVFNRFSFKKNHGPYSTWIFKTAFLLLGSIGIYKGIVYTKTLDKNFKKWQIASSIYKYGDYQGSIKEFENAYPMLKTDGDFLMNYGKSLIMNKNSEKALQILEEAKLYLNTTIIETALGDAYKDVRKYKRAELAYQHAYYMIPARFYPLYLQAKLYEQSGQIDKAKAMAKSILTKDIKVPSTAIKEIKAEMKMIVKNNNATAIPSEAKKSYQ